MNPLIPLTFLSQPITEWLTQVGVGGAFVVVVLLVLWKIGAFRPASPALTTGSTPPSYWEVKLNDIKGAVERVEREVETVGAALDAKITTTHAEVVAVRAHLHDLRDALSPLKLAVELLLERLCERGDYGK